MTENIKKEIIELHAFFENWAAARISSDQESFNRFAGVLADEFTILTPDAKIISGEELIDSLRANYGNKRSRSGEYAIWIEDIQPRLITDTCSIAIYKEWQKDGEVKNGRLSTVVFITDKTAPNGLIWQHVHETWLNK